MTSQKTAESTSASTARMLASKSTMEASPEPTAVPLTNASPSLGCSSKNPRRCRPAGRPPQPTPAYPPP
ncbi:unnamed protein product [Spirodela intermedia]|uniref:Uncharacterized protein n=1 Tax=Spirodela intermedia TaxID=51605 RepID=A0A7I8IBR8_SPIIN|nr:unnamed protein product [Spirodela intermedia]CAA6655268.1 unnamed protein product [Spirodela intermedia]